VAGGCFCPEQGVDLTADRAWAGERHAPGRHRVRGAGFLARLLDDHGEFRAVAPDGRRDAQSWVEAVQYHVGSGYQHALLPAQERAGAGVAAGPAAEGDVEPRVLEQGVIRDRQGRPAVLDQQVGTPPGRTVR
jgi:hypothetical protein